MVEIVAELSGNHGGSLSKAMDMIRYAAHCGCDHAKFQFYRPEDMPDRHEGNNDAMYRKLMVPDEWLPDLFAVAHRFEIGLFASVFSVRAVETLLKFDVPYIKIASPSSTLLADDTYRDIIAATPPCVGLIFSTSFFPWARNRAREFDRILFCPYGHPPVITQDEVDYYYRHNFTGFSDHTPGIAAPLMFNRKRFGHDCMIEKHFKIDDDCIDAAFSAGDETMALLCKLAHR